ncbi:hypothetical protein AVEN_53639-1 [Araneus ventricosus]|uniref:Uncharacterized protein n=1 Tax=Araneus ventricosus TaxID=182803 RepID=A0A4Y2T572_ARAVE|nr:hypothetical protein AVEN_53639-1 [Araneus ventricosus]
MVCTQYSVNEDEWDEILQRFREEGLDPNLPDDRKLLYVWRWLVDAETNCISLRHQLDKLSRRQSDEMEVILALTVYMIMNH